jgi:hypothetical protein
MNELTTAVEIDAPAARVWDVLTDFAAYPSWNQRTRIEGVPETGARLTVAPGPDAEGMPTFRPHVLAAGPREDGGYELRWLGHLWVRGLFDGEHSFVVEPLGEDRCRLTQSETFRGLLAGLLLRRYRADTEAGFHAVNEALKARAESSVAAEAPGPDADATGADVAA